MTGALQAIYADFLQILHKLAVIQDSFCPGFCRLDRQEHVMY